jgi:hypothetical protein
VVRMRGPKGALAGRLCDGTPADVWHIAFVAWADTHERHAAALAATVDGAVIDLIAEESDAWCVPALERAAWARAERRRADSRRLARGDA